MIQRKVCAWSFVLLSVFCGSGAVLRASVVWYINDYDGWAAAAGDVHTIDFETLPDGSPSVAGTPITLDFNYTDQGVTFTGPVTIPFIAGNNETGFSLRVSSSPNLDRNWIIADLVDPAHAVGIHFNTTSDLSLFDVENSLIASEFINGPGGTIFFLGAVSTEPVFSATSDRGIAPQDIMAFHFASVPEPMTIILMGIVAATLMCPSLARSQQISKSQAQVIEG